MSSTVRLCARRLLTQAAISLVAFGFLAPAARCLAASQAEVESSIDKAKAYLYNALGSKDNWELVDKPDLGPTGQQQSVKAWQWGGITATAVYGLLAAGENSQDKRLASAIMWLEKHDLHGHYAIAMRSQMYQYLKDNDKDARTSAKNDAKILLNAIQSSGENKGLYAYYTDEKGVPQKSWPGDNSVSQISVLGMWALEQSGQEVPNDYWRLVDETWRKNQNHDGGWPYQNKKAESTTMTAAGIATLFITQDFLSQGTVWSVCRGGARNENIERGLAWMDKHIEQAITPSGPEGFYGMYGIEPHRRRERPQVFWDGGLERLRRRLPGPSPERRRLLRHRGSEP